MYKYGRYGRHVAAVITAVACSGKDFSGGGEHQQGKVHSVV
jgi:hypothetical protein